MSTLKDALCLLAIFVVYGVVGQMDYEDAVTAQEVQQASSPLGHPECLTNVSAADPYRSPPTKWSDNSLAWQPAGHEWCPPYAGAERARR